MPKQLFKLDLAGNMRLWWIEKDPNEPLYQINHGVLGGTIITTAWTRVEGNTLRNAMVQRDTEVEALYKHKLKTDYFETEEEADNGPRHTEPMLAKSRDKISAKNLGEAWDWIYQPKLDGIRCLAKANGCFSRSGEKFLTTGPIEEALRPLFEANPELILDGELYNHEYHDRFNELSGLIRTGLNAKRAPTASELETAHSIMQYHVYDMPSHPGEQEERVTELVDIIHEVHPLLFFVDTWACSSWPEVQQRYEKWVADGYEGMMYRRKKAKYQYGKRTWDLLKSKEFETAEFKIKRVEEGTGDWAGRVKRIVYEWHDGREFASGLRMSRAGAAAWWAHHLAGVDLYSICTVRYMPPPEGAVPRVAVAIDFFGPEGRVD